MRAAWIALGIALLVGLPSVSVGLPATVPQIPTPPTNLTSCGSSPTSVCLRWTGGTGSPLINNTVYYGLSCSSVTGVSTGLQGVSGSTFFYNLTGLHPSTAYCLWVTDWSQVGQSNPSSQLTVSTSSAPLGGQGSPITRDLITIWNNASVPTGTYQQLIVVDSARLSQQIDSNWSNVAFAYRNGTPIFAWIESNATTTSHSTYVWLKLNSIPAASSIVIEMDCYAWSVQKSSVNGPTGKAPQLTTAYAREDDGRVVFPMLYDDFVGTTVNSTTWTKITPSSIQNNGLRLVSQVTGGRNGGNNVLQSKAIFPLGVTFDALVMSEVNVNWYGVAMPGAYDTGGVLFYSQAAGGCSPTGHAGTGWSTFNGSKQFGSVSPPGCWTSNVTYVLSGTTYLDRSIAETINYSLTTVSPVQTGANYFSNTTGPLDIASNQPGPTDVQWIDVRVSANGGSVSYTLSYSLPDSPSSVSASRIAPSTTLVRWSNPLIDPSAPAKNTLVNDTILYGSNPAILDHRASVGVATSATIGNLTPGVRTWFSVQAWNQNGASTITDPVPDSGSPPPVSSTTTAAAPSIPIFWWLVFGLAVFAILGSFVLVLAVSRRDRDD